MMVGPTVAGSGSKSAMGARGGVDVVEVLVLVLLRGGKKAAGRRGTRRLMSASGLGVAGKEGK